MLLLVAAACSPRPPPHDVDLPPSAAPAASSSVAASPTVLRALDLSISFNPDFSGNDGWLLMPSALPLDMLGNNGAEVFRFQKELESPATDPLLAQLYRERFSRVDLETTSLVFDTADLCAPLFTEAVKARRPKHLLLSLQGSLTASGIACLSALRVPALYVAGCLYRGNWRDGARCDGDAEIALLAADPFLRTSIRGLAASVSSVAALTRLAELENLTYLALAKGHDPDPSVGFVTLPYDKLRTLRFLDVTSFDPDAFTFGPYARRFVGQLEVLKWNGKLDEPLDTCAMRRLSTPLPDTAALENWAACTQLASLHADSAGFDSAAPLARFTELEWLHVTHCPAEDLSPLRALVKLRDLGLRGSRASDFSFLASMTSLRSLEVSQTAFKDLWLVAGLAGLEVLDVAFDPVTDVTPLADLKRLRKLDLGHTRVSDITSLAKQHALEELNVGETSVADLSPLAHHPSMKWLILHGSKVTDLGAALTMPKLERLNVGGLTVPATQLAELKQRRGFKVDGP